ncbi:MAG: PaaI family thioesterase [Pseudomonadota bacterium]
MPETTLTPSLRINATDLVEFLEEVFEETWLGDQFEVLELEPNRGVFRFNPAPHNRRPGGTLSGPTMFAFADIGAYALINAHTGPKPLTVTTSLNMNFMRKPDLAPTLGTFEMMKLGKRLAVVRVTLANESAPDVVVADASATYAIEPDRKS